MTASGRRLRPDLLVSDCLSRAVVVDVTIRYETNDPDVFANAYSEKVRKFSGLTDQIREALGNEALDVVYHGLVIGCRGAWPAEVNSPVSSDLRIRCMLFEKMLARRVLLISTDIVRCLGERRITRTQQDD